MERRRKWKDTVGPVFDKEGQEGDCFGTKGQAPSQQDERPTIDDSPQDRYHVQHQCYRDQRRREEERTHDPTGCPKQRYQRRADH